MDYDPSTMQAQEDLVALFNNKFTLSPSQPHQPQQIPQQPPTPPQDEPKIVYISQHYTHSAHIAHRAQPTPPTQPDRPLRSPSPSALLPRSASQPDLTILECRLRAHGIDPNSLSAPQARLFKSANDAQQLRLIELWRICPPSTSNAARDGGGGWSEDTSVEREEMLARECWEARQRQRQQQEETVMSLDGTPIMLSSVCHQQQQQQQQMQTDDGRWASQDMQVQLRPVNYMEPYMLSGYEELARREYEESARRAHIEEYVWR